MPIDLELQTTWDPDPLRRAWPRSRDCHTFFERIAQLPLELTAPGATGRVLEVAAAEGLHACLLAEQGLDVRHISSNLADRDALRAELESVDAETILVELKAAAIDVVAEAAAERGARLVLLGSDVVADGLDEQLLALAEDAVREQVRA